MRHLHRCGGTDGMIRRKEYNLLLTDLNMPGINGFELLELLRSSNVGNSQTIPVVVATASGSCDAEELLERGFAGCLFKPFSISELLEISDKCAIKATQDGKPDFPPCCPTAMKLSCWKTDNGNRERNAGGTGCGNAKRSART